MCACTELCVYSSESASTLVLSCAGVCVCVRILVKALV